METRNMEATGVRPRNRQRFSDYHKAAAFACEADGNRGIWDFAHDRHHPFIAYFIGLGNGKASLVHLMPDSSVRRIARVRVIRREGFPLAVEV